MFEHIFDISNLFCEGVQNYKKEILISVTEEWIFKNFLTGKATKKILVILEFQGSGLCSYHAFDMSSRFWIKVQKLQNAKQNTSNRLVKYLENRNFVTSTLTNLRVAVLVFHRLTLQLIWEPDF